MRKIRQGVSFEREDFRKGSEKGGKKRGEYFEIEER